MKKNLTTFSGWMIGARMEIHDGLRELSADDQPKSGNAISGQTDFEFSGKHCRQVTPKKYTTHAELMLARGAMGDKISVFVFTSPSVPLLKARDDSRLTFAFWISDVAIKKSQVEF